MLPFPSETNPPEREAASRYFSEVLILPKLVESLVPTP